MGRHPRSPLPHGRFQSPDAAAAKLAAGEPLARSGRHPLKGTQPDCWQRGAGRPGQCACASGGRVLAASGCSRHSGSHGCHRNQAEAWQTGALRGSAWVAGLRGASPTSPRRRKDCSGCQESWQRADQDVESTGGDPRKQRGIPASGPPGRCAGESPKKSCTPVISRMGRPADPWADLSAEGRVESPWQQPQPLPAGVGFCATAV